VRQWARRGSRPRQPADQRYESAYPDAFRVMTEGQLRIGTFRPYATKVTVREAAALYGEHLNGREQRGERMSRGHREIVVGLITNHVLHPERGVGNTKLAQLTKGRVTEFRDRLRDDGVSVQITRKAIGTLSRVLDHAISKDMLAANAARDVEVIGTRNDRVTKVIPPSKEHFRALLSAADPDLKLKMLFAGTVGPRASEQWAIRWRHIDFSAEAVTIETRVDKFGQEDTTKSEAGVRTIPLGSGVVRALKEWRLRSAFSRDDELVFPKADGCFVEHTGFYKYAFKPVCRRVGVAGLGWHALRHFAISMSGCRQRQCRRSPATRRSR
jgi:integrase